MPEPTAKSLGKIELYVLKYREKSGTFGHPDSDITQGVVEGLAKHLDQFGRPLCPCNFYPDKQAEVARSREWFCACDEMKRSGRKRARTAADEVSLAVVSTS